MGAALDSRGPRVQIFHVITSRHHLELAECEVTAVQMTELLEISERKRVSLQRENVWEPRDAVCRHTFHLTLLSKPQTLSGNILQWPYFNLLISVLTNTNVQLVNTSNLPNTYNTSSFFVKHWQH